MQLPESIKSDIYESLQYYFTLEQASVIMKIINQITNYYNTELGRIIQNQKTHKHQIPRVTGNGQISAITGQVIRE